ncbi:GntR family transcriptional regulator [Arthrobacter castelli]|uniref:GntR family transcriptional regulator n=1 Tax=Arthrobacter castelli TaxID=271431 RepID=UPI0003FA5197|nr:GntR family transcriptional regulator [Arthrobacter castelli]
MDPAVTQASGRIVAPPSLAALAKEQLIDGVLSGTYLPGERLVEEKLCQQLGISRPPVREALKELENAGLVVQIPRRGAIVAPLTQHDVYEIVTLRNELERMAMMLALPDPPADRLQRCHRAIEEMERIVPTGNEVAMSRAGFDFHIAVIGLAQHRRLEDSYRSMALQLQVCMAMNTKARRDIEDLDGNVERHRRILELIETGTRAQVLEELDAHGHQTFLLAAVDQLDGASEASDRWLEKLRQRIDRNRPA